MRTFIFKFLIRTRQNIFRSSAQRGCASEEWEGTHSARLIELESARADKWTAPVRRSGFSAEKHACFEKGSAERAFTLIEVLVSVSIFAMVMLVATGSVFSIVEANKKTHTLKSVMTNLNFALESMAREIRVGNTYSCDGIGDCINGGTTFQFKANRDINGDGAYDSTDQVIYAVGSGRITKRILGSGPNSNASPIPITAAEISIQAMKFYVVGSAAADNKQPKVVITIQGYSGTGTTRSDFNIETTLSQRAIDS
jgi:prepilin-type N-terminal cleavage/methylation domain-containing protein